MDASPEVSMHRPDPHSFYVATQPKARRLRLKEPLPPGPFLPLLEAEDGARVYFAGDSGWCPHFAEIGARFPRLDLALLPIGALTPIPEGAWTAALMSPPACALLR